MLILVLIHLLPSTLISIKLIESFSYWNKNNLGVLQVHLNNFRKRLLILVKT